MDALSAVLSLLRPASYMFRGVDAAGRWAIAFAAQPGVLCFAITRGQAWLAVDGLDDVLLQAGDCVLLPKALAVRIGSAPDVVPRDAWDVFPAVPEGGVATLNGGGDVLGLGGFFDFGGRHADMLLASLPAIVHLRRASDRGDLLHSIERIMQELRDPQPGGFLVAQHLSHLILLQALRLGTHDPSGGWLHALGDRQIGAVLNALHRDPAHKWTLATLAAGAHMSRSAFALRFKTLVGQAPLDYLTRWRMLLAADRLLLAREPIAAIAPAVGYASESAFSTAFRRVMGCSPRGYTQREAIRKSS